MKPLIFLTIALFLNVNLVFSGRLLAGESPLTPKSAFFQYWDKEIYTKSPPPPFFLSKLSPLTAVDSAAFSKLAAQNALSTKLPAFCSAANLFCFPEMSPNLRKHDKDVNFADYLNRNFTNYGTKMAAGTDAFKNYSSGVLFNDPVNSFRRYGRDGTDRNEKFSSYGADANVADESFNTYGTGGTGGAGDFKEYTPGINVPNLRFTTYSDDATGKSQEFTSYSVDSNSGVQSFKGYGKNGNGSPLEFAGYGTGSNVISSEFGNYGENENSGFDNFTSYGNNGNNPANRFNNYGAGGTGAVDSFSGYRDQSNVGDDSFESYAKKSNDGTVKFDNYGKSFNEGTDNFTGYGESASGQEIQFKEYGINTTFKEYSKDGVSFAEYSNVSSINGAKIIKLKSSGNSVNRWVEPGKFFRESDLKMGNVIPMPDIRDKMPGRSFLPRGIVSKLPFSTSGLDQLKCAFHVRDNSMMERIMVNALAECERAPSPGETKRCVGSAEDMVDFVVSVLGRNVAPRTTDNVAGSKANIMIGSVRGIDGGKVTESVSCHQSLYPYLLYYCHSVPKVRVYEADILDPDSESKINHGVAICHLDTSFWSPTHGAFIALGSKPGEIEVCHWIFENDLTWTVAA